MTKKIFAALLVLVFAAAMSFGQAAQKTTRGMSLNGATGLIATPTAEIGWEQGAEIGVDAGYHIVFDDGATHIPKAAVSLFRKLEIAVAYDTVGSDRYEEPDTDPWAVLINGKYQVYKQGSSAVAIGGNFQYIDDLWAESWNAGQVYAVMTYAGNFFNMPASTSMTIGKSFSNKHYGERLVQNGDIDFSMGFELTLFPELFNTYVNSVQWINDFSNYSYSVVPAGSVTAYRASYNTGLRIDPLKNTDFKFLIDLIVADVFDDDDRSDSGRSFICGLTFGMALK